MAEEMGTEQKGFKIWRNPSKPGEPVVYLGSYDPPRGNFCFTTEDLLDLGFGPGHYTVRLPDDRPYAKLFSKWQKVTVPK